MNLSNYRMGSINLTDHYYFSPFPMIFISLLFLSGFKVFIRLSSYFHAKKKGGEILKPYVGKSYDH